MTNRTGSTGTRQGRRGYWSGFSVCLFVVLLAVFTWVVHRRLTQYESMQQTGGHHLTATKVCLTERPQVSVPSEQTMDRFAVMFVAFSFAFALSGLAESHGSSFCFDDLHRFHRRRLYPGLNHFFFLPPPALASYL